MTDWDTFLKSAERQFGVGSLFDYSNTRIPAIPKVSFGSPKIDIASCGGAAKGRIIEIIGEESSGKTTTCLHLVAQCQKDPVFVAEGRKAGFVDVEHALDLNYAAKLGVDVKNFLLSQPTTAENALDMTEFLVRSGKFSIVVVDSVAGLVPKAELEGEMGDTTVGLTARLMGKACRKLIGVANETGTLVVFTNQIRSKIGVMFGDPRTTPGGNALKFFASQRLEISRSISKAEKDSNGEVLSFPTNIKFIKNKLGPPFRVAHVDIERNVGINIAAEILDLAVHYGMVQKSGHHYEIIDPRRTQFFQSIADTNPQTPEELQAIPLFHEIVDPESVEFKRLIGPTIKNLRFTDNSWKVSGRSNAVASLRSPENEQLFKDLEARVRKNLNFAEDITLDNDDSVKE